MSLKNRLNSAFQSQLGIIVEDSSVTQAANDLLEIAAQLSEAIAQHERSLKDAKLQLENIVEQLNTKLGWEIRRRQGKMMVTHRNGLVNAGYYSNNLGFRPDLSRKAWQVEGPLSRHFKREHPEALELNSSPDLLADAVVNFFKTRYKTLA